MKKWLCVLLCALFLSGCSQPEAMETVNDIYAVPELPEAQEVFFWLPEGAALSVSEGTGELYVCDDFTALVQVFSSGDLDATVRAVTGYGKDRLELLGWKTAQGQRWECAWASAGENGDQIARTLIVDDGNYHYTLTLQAEAEKGGELALDWNEIFQTFELGREEITKG